MSTRTRFLALVPLSLAVLAYAATGQESRPQSRHSAEADIELIQDFRVWAAAHPDAASRLKARMDRNDDGKVDENERAHALEILVEKRAEMREWVEAHPRLAAGHRPEAGEKLPEENGTAESREKTDQERAKKLFVHDSELQVQPPERPPIQKKADAKVVPAQRAQARKPAGEESGGDEGSDPKEHEKANDAKRERRSSDAERKPAQPARLGR